MIKVKLSSIFVSDQEKALEFYTKTLGFVKKVAVPVGDYKWLTVGSAESEFEMPLEPNAHPAAKTYQKAIFEDGIPATMLFVDDIDAEYNRLKNAGVEFQSEPIGMGEVRIAAFNDTCGNWIQLCQQQRG
jgi:predicted enzyme related to lactoylglutathione lyase